MQKLYIYFKYSLDIINCLFPDRASP